MSTVANKGKTGKVMPKNFDYIKAYQWQKGQSGNPSGRPPEPLKVFAREFISKLRPEEKLAFVKEISKDIVWRMAEGNPAQENKIEHSGEIKTDKQLTPEQIAAIDKITLDDQG